MKYFVALVVGFGFLFGVSHGAAEEENREKRTPNVNQQIR